MQRLQIHLHSLCWNERRMIPWFLQHYLPIVDKIFIYDNYSTDGSVALLSGDERIRVEQFKVVGDSVIAELRAMSETMWHQSRGKADWVFVADMDEHLYHQDMRSCLSGCTAEGVTAVRVAGYQMVSVHFPAADKPLTASVTHGFRDTEFDKFCVFVPEAIAATNFDEGRHRSRPIGRVNWSPKSNIKLLHYKDLGLTYLVDRSAELRAELHFPYPCTRAINHAGALAWRKFGARRLPGRIGSLST